MSLPLVVVGELPFTKLAGVLLDLEMDSVVVTPVNQGLILALEDPPTHWTDGLVVYNN